MGVEETLHAIKSEMATDASAKETKLDTLKATMAELLGKVKEAEDGLSARKEALEVATVTLAEATATANASGETLAECQSAHATCATNLASLQEDRTELEKAFQAHFQVPMEAGEGPHFKELEPFLQNMELEASLQNTLPGTCAKTKENRGSFDDVILEQLEKAIVARISTLGESVARETSTVAEHATAVSNAESEYNLKKEAETRSTSELEAAQKEQSDAEAALVKANAAVDEFRGELEEATEVCESSKAKLVGFEGGPLANFMTYKTRTVAPEAALAAGA